MGLWLSRGAVILLRGDPGFQASPPPTLPVVEAGGSKRPLSQPHSPISSYRITVPRLAFSSREEKENTEALRPRPAGICRLGLLEGVRGVGWGGVGGSRGALASLQGGI